MQERTPYEMLGGPQSLRELVDRFYDLMDLEPEFAELREAARARIQARIAERRSRRQAVQNQS